METFNTILWTAGVVAPVFYAAGSMHIIGRCWSWAKRKLTGEMDKAGIK